MLVGRDENASCPILPTFLSSLKSFPVPAPPPRIDSRKNDDIDLF